MPSRPRRATPPRCCRSVASERIFRIYLPASLPSIVAGLRVALSIGLVLVVISEFAGEGTVSGYYILDQQGQFATPRCTPASSSSACSGTRSTCSSVWSSGACWHGTTGRSVNELADVVNEVPSEPVLRVSGLGKRYADDGRRPWRRHVRRHGRGAPRSGRSLGLRQDDPASSSLRADLAERGQRAPRRPARRTAAAPRSRSSSRTTAARSFRG